MIQSMEPMGLPLFEVQHRLLAFLLEPGAEVPGFVLAVPNAEGADGLEIYSEAYRLRLIEALETDYPALHALLGDGGFADLGRAYLDAYPSNHFSIRWFGRHLSRFLTEAAPYSAQPALGELAAFEWALSEAFDACDCPSMGFAQMAALRPDVWPTLRLVFHPSLRYLKLSHHVAAQWKALTQPNGTLPAETDERPVGWAVWRYDLTTFFRSLSAHEAGALEALLSGASLAETCESLCDWIEPGRVAVEIATLLQQWIREGWIAGTGHTD